MSYRISIFQRITDFFNANFGAIGTVILLPLLAAVILFGITYLYSKRKGITLDEEFHTKSFLLSVSFVFSWVFYFVIPETIKLPLADLSIRSILLILAIILTIQYLVMLGVSFFAPDKTIVALGIGAGCIKSTLAVSVMAPIAAENPDLTHTAAASVMIANTVAIFRNFIIIIVVGIFLGLFLIPPIFLLVPMSLMLISCLAIAGILYHKSKEEHKVQFDPVSLKGTFLFIVLFVVSYYIAYLILQAGSFFGFYGLSGIAGFLYGGAHLFVIAGLLFTKIVSLDVALAGAVFVTAASIISDIPYAYLNDAEELTKILIVAELVPFAIGIASLIFLAPHLF